MTVQQCCLTLGWDTIGWDNISSDVQILGIDLSPVGEITITRRGDMNEGYLKLYCGYKYTRLYMINRILGQNQLWLQVNGHDWFQLHGLRWLVRNGEGSKKSKWKYMIPAGFKPTPCQSTTGKSALYTARPRCLNIKWSICSLTVFWDMNTNGICDNTCMKSVMVWYPMQKFCKQLLY